MNIFSSPLDFQNLLKALHGRFFKQYLIFVLANQMSSGLFRMTGALGRNIIVANTFGSFALLAVLVLGGFILSRGGLDTFTLIYFVKCDDIKF